MRLLALLCLVAVLCCAPPPLVESKHHHNNNNRLMELLTAGIVAKVLQKNEGEEGGGGHEYYPVPIHVPVHHHQGHHEHHHASGSHHHHVTEKIIPIPIPQHTTRIIHINADKPNSLGGGQDSSFNIGGGYGGSSNNNNNNYESGESEDHPPPRHPHSSPSIQQIFFQDSGLYQPPKPRYHPYHHPAYAMSSTYKRPAAAVMMPSGTHPAYMVRARYPYVAMRYPAAGYAVPGMYGMPYRRPPYAAATYMSPMVVRRPPYMPYMPPPMWK